MELFYIALYIPLIPAIIAIFKWSKMNMSQKIFVGLLWFIVVISFSGRAWALITSSNNLPFFYTYILGELIMLLLIFRLMFNTGIRDRYWATLLVGFSLIWLINVSIGQGWWAFPDYIRALEATIVLIIIILWFLKMLREKIILQPYKTFEFWLCAGLLIFFSGNFLLFVFPKYILTAGEEVFEAIWKVNAILNILLYLMYTIALLWVKKTVK